MTRQNRVGTTIASVTPRLPI